MTEKIDILEENGKKKVRLYDDGYGLQLLTMMNGFQWFGTTVDEELLSMIYRVLIQYRDEYL